MARGGGRASGQSDGVIAVTSVSVPGTLTVKAGTTFALRGDALGLAGHKLHYECRYSSGNTAVVKCGDTGYHQAIAAGSAVITVSAKGQSATCTVTVV